MLVAESFLKDRGRTQRKKPHHGADFQALGRSVGKAQHVVKKAVFLIPHSDVIRAYIVERRRDGKEVVEKFEHHFDVGVVIFCKHHGELEHVLSKEAHPSGAVSLFEPAAHGQCAGAIERADIVESKEAALKDIVAAGILAVDPPCEVNQQPPERGLEETVVTLSAVGNLLPVESHYRKCMNRRVYIAEVPLISRHLAIGMKVGAAEH